MNQQIYSSGPQQSVDNLNKSLGDRNNEKWSHKHNKPDYGVIVRYQPDNETGNVPVTFWHNEISVPGQVYPYTNNLWDGFEADTATLVAVYDLSYSQIRDQLYGKGKVDESRTVDHWEWGVMYPHDSNAADTYARALPAFNQWNEGGKDKLDIPDTNQAWEYGTGDNTKSFTLGSNSKDNKATETTNFVGPANKSSGPPDLYHAASDPNVALSKGLGAGIHLEPPSHTGDRFFFQLNNNVRNIDHLNNYEMLSKCSWGYYGKANINQLYDIGSGQDKLLSGLAEWKKAYDLDFQQSTYQNKYGNGIDVVIPWVSDFGDLIFYTNLLWNAKDTIYNLANPPWDDDVDPQRYWGWNEIPVEEAWSKTRNNSGVEDSGFAIVLPSRAKNEYLSLQDFRNRNNQFNTHLSRQFDEYCDNGFIGNGSYVYVAHQKFDPEITSWYWKKVFTLEDFTVPSINYKGRIYKVQGGVMSY
jgi:hypothetical protein